MTAGLPCSITNHAMDVWLLRTVNINIIMYNVSPSLVAIGLTYAMLPGSE